MPLRISFSRTSKLYNYFILSKWKHWNVLDMQLRETSTLNKIQHKLKFKACEICKVRDIYVAQLRLGLSKLNTHLFLLTIVPTPHCPKCPDQVPKTVSHYPSDDWNNWNKE